MRKVISECTRAAGRTYRPTSPLLCITLLIGVIIAGLMFVAPDSAEATGSITLCTDCHGSPPFDNPTRDGATGRFPGSHNVHAGTWSTAYGINCEVCHNAPNWTAFNHQGDTIQLNLRWVSMAGGVVQAGSAPGWGSYSRGTAFTNWSTMPVTSFGTCSSTYCHSNGTGGTTTTGDPRAIAANTSPRWGTVTPNCSPCHGNETGNPGTGAPWYTNAVKGNSHREHAPGASGTGICNKCHFSTTNTGNTITSVGNHIKRTYTVTPGAGINFTYAFSTFNSTCTNASCHSSNATGGKVMRWGSNNSLTAMCVHCHGVSWATTGLFNSNNAVSAPGYWRTGRNTWDTVGTITNNVSNAAKVWAHDSHLNSQAVKGYTTLRGVECDDCHSFTAIVADVYSSNHMNGATQFSWSSLVRNVGNNNPKWGNQVLQPWYSSGNQACGNIYCHGGTLAWTSTNGSMTTIGGIAGTGWISLRFDNNRWLTVASAKDSASCHQCHDAPPARTTNFDHGSYTLASDCSGCHGHNGAGAGHINGILYGSGSCTGCHNNVQNAPWASTLTAGAVGSRRAVVAEFAGPWSHKRSASFAVTDVDCIVCHLEGDATTKTTDATYHKNGQIDLRDPDTGGRVEQAVWVWSTTTRGGGWYTAVTNAWLTFVRFSRNLNSAVLEPATVAQQINFCLKCHDANGAASSLAWSTSTATAQKPFNTTIAGSDYTGAGTTAGGVTGGVVDVKDAFWSSNNTYHPVLVRNDNSFTWGTRMVTPWNSLASQGAMPKTWGSVGRWGLLITCWDCHAKPTDTGTITASLTAHGWTSTVAVRGNAWSTSTLCFKCHSGYNNDANNQGGESHGSGSAFDVGTNGGMVDYVTANCHYCHASRFTKPARPVPAQDVHGWRGLWYTNATGRWYTSVWQASNTKPYAFIRNTQGWSSVGATAAAHKVKTGPGVTTTTSGSCARPPGAGGVCNNSMGTYTPGGNY